MNTDFNLTRSINGICRYCSIDGNHRELNTEYSCNGIREVYSDMIQECFGLSLSTKAGLTTLICSECIRRLRDASSFKILVVETEKQLHETVKTIFGHDNVIQTGIMCKVINSVKLEYEPGVKVESWSYCHRSLSEDSSDNYLYDGNTASDDTDTFEDVVQQQVDLVPGERELLQRFPARSVKPLPTRATLKKICPVFAEHLKLLKGKNVTGKSLETLLLRRSNTKLAKPIINKDTKNIDISKLAKKRIQRTKYKNKEIDINKEKNPSTIERLTHAANITAVLELSNVTAFKAKHQRAYPCFYCEKLFEDFEDLRTHQVAEHTKENVGQCVLNKYRVGKPDGLVVYVDVTDLQCKVCNKSISNLQELKTHLTGTHQKKMYLELTDRVIPFKVRENNFECQICGTKYETFGSVERHMNTHYRNYVCEECGSGFITKQRLRIHGYLMHSKKPTLLSCDVCQKQFATQQKRKIHVETVHENVKKYKCNRCPERFNEYFRRHKHMVIAHGVAPIEYKCNVCDKTFERRYALSIHMRTHIQQKDVYCEICPYRCFSKVELRHHMVKHNGKRIHECSVCKKSYAREKTLKEHMRIHNNDRRFVCPVCGVAFIQNCSLKSHIKSHHKEYGHT